MIDQPYGCDLLGAGEPVERARGIVPDITRAEARGEGGGGPRREKALLTVAAPPPAARRGGRMFGGGPAKMLAWAVPIWWNTAPVERPSLPGPSFKEGHTCLESRRRPW